MYEVEKHKNIIEYIEFGVNIQKILITYSEDEDIEDVFKSENHYLALEYAENRSLIDYLNSGNRYDKSWLKHWFRQIVKGCQHIKSK